MTNTHRVDECIKTIRGLSCRIFANTAETLRHESPTLKWTVVGSLCALLLLATVVVFVFLSYSSRLYVQVLPPIPITLKTSALIQETEPNDCIVHTEGNYGRLGNAMFMVASAFGLAQLHGCRLSLSPRATDQLQDVFILDLSPWLISQATFRAVTANGSKPRERMSREVGCEYVDELTRPNAIPRGAIFELQGYWLSYLHFAKYDDDIRQKFFIAKKPVLDQVSNFFGKLLKEKLNADIQLSPHDHLSLKQQLAQSDLATWVGVHVRRTDMGTLNFSSTRDYFLFAMQYYLDRFPDAFFIVAGDDKSYCRSLFRKLSNVIITPRSFSPGEDMVALSLCQHSIITAGTFGWWAAFLANGDVVHDVVYPSGCTNRVYYYPPWYMLNGHIRATATSDFVL